MAGIDGHRAVGRAGHLPESRGICVFKRAVAHQFRVAAAISRKVDVFEENAPKLRSHRVTCLVGFDANRGGLRAALGREEGGEEMCLGPVHGGS